MKVLAPTLITLFHQAGILVVATVMVTSKFRVYGALDTLGLKVTQCRSISYCVRRGAIALDWIH